MDWIFAKLQQLGDFGLAHILPGLLILVVGILAIRIVLRIVKAALNKSKLEKAAHKLICSVIKVALLLMLGLVVASKLGIDITGVVALASVLTLAISLSVQNALTNLIGGFTLLNTKPFSSGDYVEIAGQSGTVQEIGLTYTKLTTPDNKTISIPNSSVVAAEIVNYTVAGTRRVDVAVSASYDAPVDKVLEALLEAGTVDGILPDKEPFSAVTSYGDHAINYTLRVWCNTADYWNTLCTVNKKVKDVFDAKGIEMTYPHLNVHLDK
jgi:small conductance mechanosensitive channel